jgi:hypothetical protein
MLAFKQAMNARQNELYAQQNELIALRRQAAASSAAPPPTEPAAPTAPADCLVVFLANSPFSVPMQALRANATLHIDHPGVQSYTIESRVSVEDLREFLCAIKGSQFSLKPDNVHQLTLLCDEFGATRLRHVCDEFVERASALAVTQSVAVLPQSSAEFVRRDHPMSGQGSLDGIISHTTKKHSGNVHERGIITLNAKSACDDPNQAPKNVADLISDSQFVSKNEPGQWICWDFRWNLVRATDYTMVSAYLTSWVLEGSLDGANWTEIDRKSNNQEFIGGWNTASFTAASAMEWRFIRLTQMHKGHDGSDCLRLRALEFFGTFAE